MRTKKIKVVSISLAPYGRTLWIIANVPQRDYLAWIKKHFHVDLDEQSCSGRFEAFEKGTYVGRVIWLSRYRVKIEEVGLLAHEIYHTAMCVWREMKTEVNEATEELFASFQQMLLVAAMAELGKWRSRQKT